MGRKGTLLFTSIPFVFGWLLMAYAGRMESAVVLLMGRFITGFCCGLISLSAPVYIAETANPSKRGFLGSGFQLSVTLGIVFTYLTGKYVSWAYLALISCIYPIMLLISMTLMPETPYWLIKKARISEATEANLFLHGSNGAQNIEVDTSVPSIDSDGLQTGTNKLNLSEFMKPHIRKPILLSLSLMFFQQFSGVNAIIFYTTTIFESAGSQAISPNDATILVGFVQVVATFGACLLTDKAGRRMLLVISGIGCGLSLVLMSVFYFVSSFSDTFKSTYGWIPIIALISFIIAFSLGMGPIPWLLMGELLPAHVKSIASGLSSSFNWMCAFLITFFFSYLISGLRDSGTYLLFAIISFVSSVFVIFLLPETRGKSLQEIENLFKGESMS